MSQTKPAREIDVEDMKDMLSTIEEDLKYLESGETLDEQIINVSAALENMALLSSLLVKLQAQLKK